MKLSEYAKKVGVSYRTVHRWYKENKLPDNITAKQMPSGTIIIDYNDIIKEKKIVIYCRVSSYEKKDDLSRQVERCKTYCLNKGLKIDKIYKEIASGMNDNRKQLLKMFDYNPNIIIIENKDRLTRFGFNYLKYFLNKKNTEIEILNPDNDDEKDLMKDLISIITSFCCRLYGLRRGKNNSKKIIKQIENTSF